MIDWIKRELNARYTIAHTLGTTTNEGHPMSEQDETVLMSDMAGQWEPGDAEPADVDTVYNAAGYALFRNRRFGTWYRPGLPGTSWDDALAEHGPVFADTDKAARFRDDKEDSDRLDAIGTDLTTCERAAAEWSAHTRKLLTIRDTALPHVMRSTDEWFERERPAMDVDTDRFHELIGELVRVCDHISATYGRRHHDLAVALDTETYDAQEGPTA